MPAVSNTSPILNLAIINQLELLQQQFGEILIPDAVYTELKLESDYPGNPTIRHAIEQNWIKTAAIKEDPLARALQFELDAGESAAIALTIKRGERQILLDEREGRRRAKSLGLTPTGVLGVLLRAKQEGNISSMALMIQRLRQQAGFHLSENLVNQILAAAGEEIDDSF